MKEAETTNGGTTQTQRELTFGEKRVGITFNPGNNPAVDHVKSAAAQLIDICKSGMDAANSEGNSEAARCFAQACTVFEDAAMWAVKGITKPKA